MFEKYFIPLRDNIDARHLRERALIFICLLAVVFVLWSLFIQSHVDKRSRELRSDAAAINSQREKLSTEIAEATRLLTADPNREQKNRITQLEQEIQQADQSLISVSQGLVLASDLPQLLRQTLAQTTKLKLNSLETLPTRELALRATTLGGQGAGVYQHAVVLHLSGSYFQVLDFVKALEATGVRFYWDRLDYQVQRYPQAEIEIRVYTLSTDRGPLGG